MHISMLKTNDHLLIRLMECEPLCKKLSVTWCNVLSNGQSYTLSSPPLNLKPQ